MNESLSGTRKAKSASVREARRGMAEVLAHLYFGQHFERVVTDEEGLCSVAGPVNGSVPEVNARIAIAGPCADLAFDIIEPPFPDDETVMRVVENWQVDARDAEPGEMNSILRTRGLVQTVAPWSLAFVRENLDLVEAAAAFFLARNGTLGYQECADQFLGSAIAPSAETLQLSGMTLGFAALRDVDEAVQEHLAEQQYLSEGK